MGINLTILEGLPGNLRQQLEDFVNQLGANLGVEHEDDGTHKGITGPGNLFKGGHGTFHGQLKCRVGIPNLYVVPAASELPIPWEAPLHSDATAADDFYDNGRLYSTNQIYFPASKWFLPPEEGNYLYIANVRWPPVPGDVEYQLMIRQGGDEIAKVTIAAHPALALSTFVCGVVPLPPPDTVPVIGALQRVAVQISAFHTYGADLTVGGGSSSNFCQVIKLS